MPKLDLSKYQQSILYFTKFCNNRYLGDTKLNKLLYYLDFVSYRDRKTSVTKDIYIHKDYGPVPQKVDEILVGLKEDKLIVVNYIPYRNGHTTEFIVRTEPDMSVFDDYEKNLLEKICKEFFLWSTDKIVNQTHAESPWLYSDPLDVVDYNYANDIDFFLN